VIRLELAIVVLVVVDDKLLTLKWKIDTLLAVTRPVRNVSFKKNYCSKLTDIDIFERIVPFLSRVILSG